ncbi:MAG: MoxR family ATPase [Veillonellaceae bacterium]|nr:MoxR family ATPase [Veillonellaceae bacterium]MDY4484565.1 MoxR family ATPase [Anaerovibrio sp.]MCI7079185.1 MoxR family ATPase [Veillonellaceae bacterium]MCI7090574.1 MoxR family ATPase [Veillonellaceae bacterium]MCI7236324.1 MoxR family ATPase [Veillonellaceae bacterium]
MLTFLQEQGIAPCLIDSLEAYKAAYPWSNQDRPLLAPGFQYYGKEIWEQALGALLAGENLLLVGAKATGKNVLAENLAYCFGRGDWNVSFHVNMDAAMMLGSDTFRDGQVQFRPGPVYECASQGGFCILDEINMARNEALAALHSMLDFRRILDIPGYGRLKMHPATRFIATMNYGYAGTRELNEALASRFAVIALPPANEHMLANLLEKQYGHLSDKIRSSVIALFMDLQLKYQQGEISSKAVDLRGLLGALGIYQQGLGLRSALQMGLVNKVFNEDERQIIQDLLDLRIGKD